MRVTLKDIARHTGLSVSTVSLVLNNKEHRLSTETRDRVLLAAKELNYRPNQLAKSLITKKTATIGLIIPDVTNMFFSVIAKAVQARCQALGFYVFLCNTNDNPQKDVEYIDVMLDRGVDGILLAMAAGSSERNALECCDIMRRMGKPLVLVDRTCPDAPAPSVLVDFELGGYLATRHLLELGHRRIGCITGPMNLQSSKQRLFGYIRALQEYGVSFDPALTEESEYQILSDYGIVRRLLDKRVSAVFAYNDLIAYGVFQQAMKNHLEIPRDFSLVGFDNLPFSEMMAVPLTTVEQSGHDVGEAAAELLIEMINNSGADMKRESIMFTPKLIVRESTRAPG